MARFDEIEARSLFVPARSFGQSVSLFFSVTLNERCWWRHSRMDHPFFPHFTPSGAVLTSFAGANASTNLLQPGNFLKLRCTLVLSHACRPCGSVILHLT